MDVIIINGKNVRDRTMNIPTIGFVSIKIGRQILLYEVSRSSNIIIYDVDTKYEQGATRRKKF